MTAGWCTRTVRAAMFAAVCVVLAALGHLMMSGSPVAWWALACAGAATAGAGWCLAGRERGLPLIVSVVVLAQGVLHTAFSITQSLTADARADMGPASGPDRSGTGAMDAMHGMSGMPTGAMGHDMGSLPMGSVHMASMDMSSMGAMDMGYIGSGALAHLLPMGHEAGSPSSFGMLAAHVLAALLCGFWLAYGERAVFRTLRALAGRLAAPLRLLLDLPTPPHRPRVRARRASSDRAPRRLLLVHAITSRGPPVGTTVA
ncbi:MULTISPECIES: hypothetical protein [unclassified Streptomyces]|uniref:hypothetical protein n=1 Tax=unclassified Streptomyces TaxID=2593676 RepID=UPI0022526A67|nr:MULTISPECIES: hypothetical protein [unclassified Streptomyces]MCX4992678.1 hypothetical protein [Streptomyces sp. NBC_00568]MCX5002085.1 hypothetical protein [Streptomyces sp. NBC_00638]